MSPLRLALCPLALFAIAPLGAQDLGGGAPASHGRVPRFSFSSWLPGQPTQLAFSDLPASFILGGGLISLGTTQINLPGIGGTLIADPATAVAIPVQGPVSFQMPLSMSGQSLVIQGVVIDGGISLTDATRVNVFTPVVMVGNQRQSSNSLSVVDIVNQTVVHRLGNSENGSIAYSPDRTRAYVCEPGSLRNYVSVYDLTASPIVQLTTVPTTGGIRYRGEFAPDGLRLYVPIHNGVDVIDTDPSSPSYHTVVNTIPTPITGNSGTIFTGPIDLAVTPDNQRLLIAYGQSIPGWPGTTTAGVVDLQAPGQPYRSIALTAGGVVTLLNNLTTHVSVRVSPDGRYAYFLEYGFLPGAFSLGFQNGGLLNVVDLTTETEVAAIPTGGFSQREMTMDYLGRNLWLPQTDINGYGEVVQVDVDRRSATRNSIVNRIAVDPIPYSVTNGPAGAATTPDGGWLMVSVIEDGNHPTPVLLTYDTATGTPIGGAITVESLPATVEAQQR